MSRRRKKALLKLALIAVVGLIGLGALYSAVILASGINRSGETADIFNDAATVPPDLIDAVTWTDEGMGIESLDPLTLESVVSAWLRAWTQISILSATGQTEGIDVYFTGPANQSMTAARHEWAGREAKQISHRLTLEFVSIDRQVISLGVDEIRLLRRHVFADGVGFYESSESYEAILLLEDGNWRIRHWVRRSEAGTWWSEPAPEASGTIPADLRGINYYPRKSPFGDFLPNFDPEEVADDFDRIRDLGCNSIRVFVDFEALGARWVDEELLEHFVTILDLAEERDLGVVVTLFDGRTDHNTDKWDTDDAHLERVVPALADHPALLFWDLKNEPDRDFGIMGAEPELVYAWLSHVARKVRSLDPVTPMTVGWSTPDAAVAAPVVTDLVSYHYYGPTSDFATSFNAVKAVAGSRPVLITEYGLPTWNTFLPGGHTEAEQADYYARLLTESERLGADGTMAWTLWDFAAAPPDAGFLPWNAGPQTTLGLIRPDGSAKPAASLLALDADLDDTPPVGYKNRLKKPFWQLVFGIGVMLFVLWAVGGRYLRKARAMVLD